MSLADIEPAGGRERWKLAGALAITLLVAYYDRLNVSFAMPLLAREQGWTPEQTGDHGSLLMGLFYVGYGLSNIFLTPLAARLGPRRALLVILSLWSLMTALGAVASSVLLLFMATRVLLGLSEGVHFPMMSLLTKRWFPLHERSRANGLWVAGIYVAVLSAPLVLVPAMDRYGWRSGFLLLALCSLIVSVPCVMRCVFDRPSLHPRITPAEQRYVTQRLAAEDGADRASSPGPFKAALLNRAFIAMVIAGILNNIVALGLSGWLPTYLAGRTGVHYADLRYLAALPYAASLAGLVLWSHLGDRIGRRGLLAGVGYLCAGTSIYAAFHATSIWPTAALFGVATFFVASFTCAEFALLQRMLPLDHVANGSGIYNGVTTLVGGGLGPFVVKGVLTDGTALSALLPIVIPCLVIGLSVAFVGRRLDY